MAGMSVLYIEHEEKVYKMEAGRDLCGDIEYKGAAYYCATAFVTAYAQKNFLIIRFENYCEENLDFENVFPATTKADAGFHGYGLKSLRYTVHKYGGEVDAGTQDNWFVLKILIPMTIQ